MSKLSRDAFTIKNSKGTFLLVWDVLRDEKPNLMNKKTEDIKSLTKKDEDLVWMKRTVIVVLEAGPIERKYQIQGPVTLKNIIQVINMFYKEEIREKDKIKIKNAIENDDWDDVFENAESAKTYAQLSNPKINYKGFKIDKSKDKKGQYRIMIEDSL